MENNRFPREVALCLSGGAARGAFHLGAISVLEENGVKIKAISGTSIGSLIGAALACGRSAKEIYDAVRTKEFKRDVFKLKLFQGYLFELDDNADILRRLIDKESFEELEVPLSVTVTELGEEGVEYFSQGDDFRKAVLASCSITPLFKPVELNGKLLIDGGLIDNFPVEQLQKYDYPIVGINLFPKFKRDVRSIFGWLYKNLYLMWQSHNLVKKSLCDIYICSDELDNIRVFSFKDIEKAYELGRLEMQKYFS